MPNSVTGSAGPDGSDEDSELLWQATSRAEALLDDLAAGHAPAQELDALLGYLREVVLARISEEERLVFPALTQTDSAQADTPQPGTASRADVDRLHSEHLQLREDVDELAAAAGPSAATDAAQLATVIRRLIVRLEEHLRGEAEALAGRPGGYPSAGAGWTTAEHWFPLTEGPLLDLDRLRPEQADDAVLNRLAHLRPGEQVDLRCSSDPQRLWVRLQRRAPGDYRWSEQRDGEGAWLVSVTRRTGD